MYAVHMSSKKIRVRTPTMVLAARVAELRKKKGWSAAKLAEACADQGMPKLNRPVISNIESGRRQGVTLEEMMVLAVVLDVAPVHLFVPIDDDDESYLDQYSATPEIYLTASKARAWVRGDRQLNVQDPRMYFSEVPKEDFRVQKPSEAEIQQDADDIALYRELTAKLGFVDLTEGEDGFDPEES